MQQLTPDELAALAAECEARAKAGEGPTEGFWQSVSGKTWKATVIGCVSLKVETFGGSGYHANLAAPGVTLPAAMTSDEFYDDTTRPDYPEFVNPVAAQLFAEELLRRATAPLHAKRSKTLDDLAAEQNVAPFDGDAGKLAMEGLGDDPSADLAALRAAVLKLDGEAEWLKLFRLSTDHIGKDNDDRLWSIQYDLARLLALARGTADAPLGATADDSKETAT